MATAQEFNTLLSKDEIKRLDLKIAKLNSTSYDLFCFGRFKTFVMRLFVSFSFPNQVLGRILDAEVIPKEVDNRILSQKLEQLVSLYFSSDTLNKIENFKQGQFAIIASMNQSLKNCHFSKAIKYIVSLEDSSAKSNTEYIADIEVAAKIISDRIVYNAIRSAVQFDNFLINELATKYEGKSLREIPRANFLSSFIKAQWQWKYGRRLH
ncbi:hypothetical protein BRETT_002528 [Brettanomyces bruxellensis]|uniref:Uncharacterized protein n=1 Tax=Dekkera bruxellensis TaxID=5007 RepID=A0A871RIZ2_DEKBR|nr:uncharacterized protein BRETT_002528 [Brettanomyces bruxellensis]QOU22351.1 hypothetical protein BRETT_002528 [Brettanomyces bruxellensis]